MSARVKARGSAKQSAQVELDLSKPKTWGGAREGAGRKRASRRHDPEHRTRPEHKARHPVHVTLRVLASVGRLRRRPIFHAIRRALAKTGAGATFRVPHLSIQGNHIHLIGEASDKLALARGMQRLAIVAARAINRSLGRTGRVFAFRYHRIDITSPRQARNALAYVLNNWRRHREHLTTPGAENVLLDPYSTAYALDGWRDLDELPRYERLPAAEPTTWLLRVGWRRHGALGVFETPGPLR